MEIKKMTTRAEGIKLVCEENGCEIGRIYVYMLRNDLHDQPFALFEDLFVKEECRSRGLGATLIHEAVKEAKNMHCYKIICTSREGRNELHSWYKNLGFKEHGKEFRMDF